MVLRTSLLSALLLTTAGAAWAQQPVGAGAQVQQIPPPPMRRSTIPEVRVQRPGEPATSELSGQTFAVTALRVTGQTVFSEAELIAVAGFMPSQEVSLSDLRSMAARISAHYNQRGYFVAQAYLPAQAIDAGVVTIAVVEGHYGQVQLQNSTNLSGRVATGVLAGLDSGDLVASKPLERRLLLLSDIPGVEVKSTLSPGALAGTSDLVVDVQPGRRLTGSLEADNAGNRYTGRYRVGGTVNLNNPMGWGDVASLRVLTSTKGLDYLRASYQAQLGVATLGAAYSHIDYRLGREFAPLDAKGSVDIASLYGSYPLIRSHEQNLYALVSLDAKSFEDEVGIASTTLDKTSRSVRFGMSGDANDRIGGGGWNVYSLTATLGELDIEDAGARAADRLTARTDGSYGKLEVSGARLQTLSGPFSLYAAARGQLASGNLDISEKMELGGAYAVRAYPEGEAYGDEGYVLTVEARAMLPVFSDQMPGRFQAFAFVDVGGVRLVDSPWSAGRNHATRSGAGLGVSWADDNNFVLKATYAHRLGDQAVTSGPDASDRVWLQLAKLF